MDTPQNAGFFFVIHACVGYDCFKLEVQISSMTLMLVHVSSENVPIETFNISFESTQNKQHYGTKITCTEVRKKLR